jgi:hypothetical protein
MIGAGEIRSRGWRMQREVLLDMLKQNEFTSHFSLDRVNAETASLRLNDKTASIGFIYRHIGETMNLFGAMLGVPTEVKNTTMGQTDTGHGVDVEHSRKLIAQGYAVLRWLVQHSADEDWLKPVETPFFGTATRIRLFSHALFHTSNHAGQMSLTLARGTPETQKQIPRRPNFGLARDDRRVPWVESLARRSQARQHPHRSQVLRVPFPRQGAAPGSSRADSWRLQAFNWARRQAAALLRCRAGVLRKRARPRRHPRADLRKLPRGLHPTLRSLRLRGWPCHRARR